MLVAIFERNVPKNEILTHLFLGEKYGDVPETSKLTHHKKENREERYCLKNGVKNIWHESTVSGTKVSIKELTHSLHPKPIDSNKPRLFAPAEGASPEDRG
uniref:hypothetical protein n=1 Tax=Bacillus pumilus TaxID=1408 RepID=UPI00155DA039|nr:hypothetical protein [Bacillus pumilus]